MAPIVYLLRSWLRTRWRAAVVLTVLVAVVGGVVLTVAAGAVRTLTASDRYSSSRGHIYDLTIQQESGRPRLDEVRALPAIERVDGAAFVFAGLIPNGAEEPVDTLVFAGSPAAVGAHLVEGRFANESAPDEFVATDSFLKVTGAHVGDQFGLVTITQGQADKSGFDVDEPAGPKLTATLVGELDVGPGALQDPSPITVFPSSLLDAGDVGVAATVLVAGLRRGSTVEQLRQQLDELPEGATFSIDNADWVPPDVRDAVKTQGQGLLILALIVTATAVVVSAQLLSRQVRTSIAEQTALGGVGFKRVHLIAQQLTRAAVVVVVGAALAILIAFLASGLFPLDFVRHVEPYPGRRFDVLVLIAGPALFAAAVLVWLLIALLLAGRERSRTRSSSTVDKLVTRMPSAPAATAARFTFTPASGVSRSATTPILGLAVVLCVLVGALVFGANLDRVIEQPARYGNNFDLGVGQGGDAVPDEVRQQLESDRDVAALMLYGSSTVAVGSKSLGIVGMQPVRGDLAPNTLRGRLPQGDDEIALGRGASSSLHVGVGDTLTVTTASGPQTFKVTGLAVIPPIEGSDKLGKAGLVTAAGLSRIDPEKQMSSGGIRLRKGAPTDTFERLSELTHVGIGPIDRPSDVVNLKRVRTVPYLIAAIVGGLAMLSLAHQLIVGVARRRRDFAILQALGAPSRWLTGVVHWQATMVTALVLVLALPIGVIAGSVLFRPSLERIGAPDEVFTPLAWLALTLAGLLIACNVIAAMPARRMRRLFAAETLSQD